MSGSRSVRSNRARFVLFLLVVVVAGAVCFTATANAATSIYAYLGSQGATGSAGGNFTGPTGVDVEPNGNVIVSEWTGARVQRLGHGGYPWFDTFTDSVGGPTYGHIGGIWFDDRSGVLYVGDSSRGKIARVSWAGNQFVRDIGYDTPGAVNTFASIRGVALDPWGTVYGADPTSDTVRAFSPGGTFERTIGSNALASGGLDFPWGVDWDYDGRLYAANLDAKTVSVFGPNRSFEKSWSVAGSDFPSGLCVDPGGNLFVTEGPYVSRYTTAGVFLDRWPLPGSPLHFGNFTSVRGGGDRHLCLTDEHLNKVVEIQAAVPTKYEVTAGTSRYDTAIKMSRAAYPRGLTTGDPDGYRSVVVATGEDWPDGLSAAALAGAADGPILLVTKNLPLPSGFLAELSRLHVERVFIIGGPSSVSTAVADAIDSAIPLDDSVVRIAGSSRYETSRLVGAEVLGWSASGTAFVATGADFPDALSASPLSAAKRWPVYLADPEESFIASMTSRGITSAVILGGTGSVSAAIQTSLGTALGGGRVSRWAGADRYETSAIIASETVAGGVAYPRPNRVALATGVKFADGLVAGPLQSKAWGPLLLTRPNSLPSAAQAWLQARGRWVYHVRFLGGDSSISSAVRTKVKALLWN